MWSVGEYHGVFTVGFCDAEDDAVPVEGWVSRADAEARARALNAAGITLDSYREFVGRERAARREAHGGKEARRRGR